MKFKSHLFIVVCIVACLFSSCKKTIPPQLEAIPSNATFVVALENMKLMKKGGLDNLKDYKFFKFMETELANQKPEIKDFFNKFIENPKASGLDLKQSYVYGVLQPERYYAACTFKMDDLSKFENNMKELAKINKNVPAAQDKEIYKLIAQDDLAFAWNKDLFFIFIGDLADVNFEESFAMPKEKSIINTEDFAAFMKQDYDIGFWASYSQLMGFYSQLTKMQMPDFTEIFKDSYLHTYLNFENGEIKLTGKMSPQSKVDAFYAKYPIIKKDLNNKVLEDFPENTYLTFRMAIDWNVYLNMINEYAATIGDPNIQMVFQDPTLKTIFNALGGDLIFNIYGFAQGPLPIPLLGLSATVNSKEDFDKILALIPQEIVQPVGQYYMIQLGMGAPVYLAYKDNRAFMTDDTDAIKAFTGKGYSKNLSNSILAKELKNDPTLMYINLDIDSYPENIKALLQKEGPEEIKMALSILKPFKEIVYGADKNSEMFLSLKFKDKSQNSLKLLLKSIDEMATSQYN